MNHKCFFWLQIITPAVFLLNEYFPHPCTLFLDEWVILNFQIIHLQIYYYFAGYSLFCSQFVAWELTIPAVSSSWTAFVFPFRSGALTCWYLLQCLSCIFWNLYYLGCLVYPWIPFTLGELMNFTMGYPNQNSTHDYFDSHQFSSCRNFSTYSQQLDSFQNS